MLLSQLKEAEGLGTVYLEALKVRVDLDAVKAKGDQLPDVLPEGFRIRMEGAQADEGSARRLLGSVDKTVDRAHLGRGGGDGMDDEPGNAGLGPGPKQGAGRPVPGLRRQPVIKPVHRSNRLERDLVGINVAMTVNNHKFL